MSMSSPQPGGHESEMLSENYLETTDKHCSGRVWAAAHTLYAYLSQDRASIRNNQYLNGGDTDLYRLVPSSTVLELGSGTGWLALNMTAARPDLRWCATEMPQFGALDRLARNLDIHRTEHSHPCKSTDLQTDRGVGAEVHCSAHVVEKHEKQVEYSKIRVAGLNWTVPYDSLFDEKWDVIVGSDLVYSEEGAKALCTCLSRFLIKAQQAHNATTCLIAHTCGRWGAFGYDRAFYRELIGANLEAIPIGGDTLSNSDERRQHVVIFEVRLRESSENCVVPKTNLLSHIEAERNSDHVLLRGAKLHDTATRAAEAAMTVEELDEMHTFELFDKLTVEYT
eukprot:CFRG4702T1